MKPKTIKEYIASQSKEAQASLKKLHETIKKAAPGAEEYISYGMPGYRLNGIVCWFAGCKEHYSLYVRPNVKVPFEEKLKKYKSTKSAIHFEYGKPLPVGLVSDIVKHSIRINNGKK
ncbi:MAG: DUF1801 domain-containing protein [Bacteroidetes bacterium]|nr:DUF1801 domain-containing protein [Bacteroidota bacterium]